ncbi:MAG: potassium-transporting ATPase subunit F [Nocardioides sp.]|nr:potassium-transporting ATPase subunit F [Nocardioides sp.]
MLEWVAGIVAVSVIGYLLVALVRPEWF